MYIIANLTELRIHKYPGDKRQYWGIQWHQIGGSINTFANHIKIRYIDIDTCNDVIGNISIVFANLYKILAIEIGYLDYYPNDGSNRYYDGSRTSTNVSGNICVFGNKYDIESIAVRCYVNVNGEIKSLKNLKKLYFCYFLNCSVTGAKTDLYNNGANVTRFII